METFTCDNCGEVYRLKPSERKGKRSFCKKECYNKFRTKLARFSSAERRNNYSRYKRALWGGMGTGRSSAKGQKTRAFGSRFEQIAFSKVLPVEGFTELDDWSSYSNQFFIDFVGTYEGERVCVDVTTKFHAYHPEKTRLARSLGMRLFMLLISPADPSIYYLKEVDVVAGRTTTKVPMAFFHKLYEESEINVEYWPDKHYRGGGKVGEGKY